MRQVKETFLSSKATDEDIVRISKQYINDMGYAPCPHTACGLHAAHGGLLEAGHDVVTLATAYGHPMVCFANSRGRLGVLLLPPPPTREGTEHPISV